MSVIVPEELIMNATTRGAIPMQRLSLTASAIVLSLASGQGMAAVTCEGPVQDGNTWRLVCSDDGAGDQDTSVITALP
jgi:hypothetical protein